MKFAVVSTLLIRRFYLGDRRCDGGLNKKAMVEAAYRYAKEVEHSDPNLLRMEELLLCRREYSLINLLKLVLYGFSD